MQLGPDLYLCDWCGERRPKAHVRKHQWEAWEHGRPGTTGDVCITCLAGRDEPPVPVAPEELERRALEGARRLDALSDPLTPGVAGVRPLGEWSPNDPSDPFCD